MSDSIENIRKRLRDAFSKKAKLTKRTILYVKIFLVILGSTIAGAAAFFSGPTDFSGPIRDWSLASHQILGLTGLSLALIGGVFFAMTDEDVSDLLRDANSATDELISANLKNVKLQEQLEQYDDAVEQLENLYTAMSKARGTIEQAVFGKNSNEEALITTCLEVVKRDLKIAMQFEYRDHWTICVYKAEKDGAGPSELRLIAHDRSVPCEIANARRWREGVGVGGIAFAKNDEVVVPDLDDPAAGSAYRLTEEFLKPDDRDNYKSLFAVPISVGVDENSWGVVLATSDLPNYFGGEGPSPVEPEEAMRALAGIIASAVSTCRANGKKV